MVEPTDTFDRHVLICEPQPSEEQVEEWREVVHELAVGVMRVNSPLGLFELADDLAHMVEERGAGSGALGTLVARTLADVEAEGNSSTAGGLYSCVCAMLAARQIVAGDGGPIKRAAMAVATWSALSFKAPLAEPRLEELRGEILANARRESLRMASQARRRGEESVGQTGSAAAAKRVIEALRRNAALDGEELELLRWILADECRGLGLGFGDISRSETAALAMGIELGQLLAVFPTVAHYRLGKRFVKEGCLLDLARLVEAVSDDRDRLAGLCSNQPVVEACPSVFPLLTALSGGTVEGRGAGIERSLTEWWGRALLESAAAVVGSRKRWS